MLIIQYLKFYLLTTFRNPPSLFFTCIFPTLMFLITSPEWGGSPLSQMTGFIVFANYAVQTVAFMLLGMAVSQEKNGPFPKYLRTLPSSFITVILGRLGQTFFIAGINLITLFLVAVFVLSFKITVSQFLLITLVSVFGTIPMALMGMTIGYATSQESSRSIFTILNLIFLFASFSLPNTGILSYMRETMITYQWLTLSLSVLGFKNSFFGPILCLIVYSVLSAFLFIKAYKEERSFS